MKCGRTENVSRCFEQAPSQVLWPLNQMRRSVPALGLAAFVAAMASFSTPAFAEEPSEDDLAFFENKVRPLLIERCGDCHGADAQESGLRVDTYAGMKVGGTSGPLFEPGKVDESMLIAAVSYKDQHLQMPPDGKIPDAEIEVLKDWIKRGAPHPEMNETISIEPRRTAIDLDEARQYWAFQPLKKPDIPQIEDADKWVKSPIDAFVLKQLQQKKLKPVAPADKLTLLRRTTFDLTGLPPSPEEIRDFQADNSPEAFEKVVDRLLMSPHYAERWGRHWLDVARYADSNGQDENVVHVDAWRYRDYVINSFDKDKPFNRFILEQVAGDLLREKELGEAAASSTDYELLIATGFLSMGGKILAEPDVAKMEMDIIDEQIDAIGQGILGLTLACARCHDHKFDPIYQADYYAIAGILKSTKTMSSFKTVAKWNEHTLATAEELEAKKKRDEEIAAKDKEIAEYKKTTDAEIVKAMNLPEGKAAPKVAEEKYSEEAKAHLKELRDVVAKLKAANPALPTAMGVVEGKAEDTRIHVRGSHMTLGKSVPRGVPVVIALEENLGIDETNSGRLQLARWMTDDKNPLTPRVAVNRIWRWHFGEGLVPTTDNFGKLGVKPVNGPLLDWLAADFIENGWSVKTLHKKILLSSTYQLSTHQDEANASIDPENKYHWRGSVQRLEAESIRDALLTASGMLDRQMGGSLMKYEKWGYVFNHTSMDGTTYNTNRRSLYLPVIRNNLYDLFSLFDYSSPDIPTGSRETSTVAPQALFMMNSDLIYASSSAMTERLIANGKNDVENVDELYQLALGRIPSEHERQRLLNYIDLLEDKLAAEKPDQNARKAAWIAAIQSLFASNEFIYLN